MVSASVVRRWGASDAVDGEDVLEGPVLPVVLGPSDFEGHSVAGGGDVDGGWVAGDLLAGGERRDCEFGHGGGGAVGVVPVDGDALDALVAEAEEPPAAVVGARCGEPGATGTTADGATVYCSQLQYTNRYLWSVHQNEIPNPILSAPPSAAPPPSD